MSAEQHPSIDLVDIPADKALIQKLFRLGFISDNGRQRALEILYPHNQWGVWSARILLALGVSLILSGIVYFFAFNWNEIGTLIKFVSIELAIVICLIGAKILSLNSLLGKSFLLSASVLVGVFLAVFGQIYQTGADASSLFIAWATLISGWVLLSNYMPLWVIWLTIINIAEMLYWSEGALPHDYPNINVLFAYLAVTNGAFLTFRQLLINRDISWASPTWVGIFVALAMFIFSDLPIINLIIEQNYSDSPIITTAAIGIIINIVYFLVYRFRVLKIEMLGIGILSICSIFETIAIKFLSELPNNFDALGFLSMGMFTILIFGFGVMYLRKIAELFMINSEAELYDNQDDIG